jgi:hypothetical protein
VENLASSDAATVERGAGNTIGELLLVPFEPLTVMRPLGSYGRMLALQPGVASAPDSEFIFRLLTGYQSHQAYVRRHAGDHFKNLENLIRGRHHLSGTTRGLLASQLGIESGLLDQLDSSSPDGPLLPWLLTIFQAIEGLPMRVTSAILAVDVPCPCCGSNLLQDSKSWWSEQPEHVGVAEARFVDRMLNAIIGASIVEAFIGQFQTKPDPGLVSLDSLTNPEHHPIGNWIAEMQEALGSENLAQLASDMQLRGGIGATFSHGRLKKWSAGLDVMPIDAATAIAAACGRSSAGGRRFLAARGFALVVDFLIAAADGDGASARSLAQGIVHSRLKHLCHNVQIAGAAMRGVFPRPAPAKAAVIS